MEYIKNMMPLNLQLFAEEGEGTGNEGNPDNAQLGEPEDDNAKVTTLTEDDVNRIVKQRLAREKRKWEKDHTEAERLRKMTDKGAVQQSVDDRLKGKVPLDKAKNNVLTAEEVNARKAFANALKF